MTALTSAEAYALDRMNATAFKYGLGTRIKQNEDGQNSDLATTLGAVNAPTSGTVACVAERFGAFFRLTFTLTAARIPVTDGGGSGSYGSLKLFDFIEQGIYYQACRQNYTAYAEGTALTTAAGDADFLIGIGTTAIASAADKVLATTEKDIGGQIAQTDSSGTTTGTLHTASAKIFDGTTTAADIYLNFSGSAATIDANSTLDVTGTITIVGSLLGDD